MDVGVAGGLMVVWLAVTVEWVRIMITTKPGWPGWGMERLEAATLRVWPTSLSLSPLLVRQVSPEPTALSKREQIVF
jgi:hypothetical protein